MIFPNEWRRQIVHCENLLLTALDLIECQNFAQTPHFQIAPQLEHNCDSGGYLGAVPVLRNTGWGEGAGKAVNDEEMIFLKPCI